MLLVGGYNTIYRATSGWMLAISSCEHEKTGCFQQAVLVHVPTAHWQSEVRGDVNQAARCLNVDTGGNPESFLAHLERALLASQKLVYFVSFWETEY